MDTPCRLTDEPTVPIMKGPQRWPGSSDCSHLIIILSIQLLSGISMAQMTVQASTCSQKYRSVHWSLQVGSWELCSISRKWKNHELPPAHRWQEWDQVPAAVMNKCTNKQRHFHPLMTGWEMLLHRSSYYRYFFSWAGQNTAWSIPLQWMI